MDRAGNIGNSRVFSCLCNEGFEQIDIQGLPTTVRATSATLPRPRKNAAIIPFFSTLLITFLKVL